MVLKGKKYTEEFEGIY